ncbi:MAG: histidinol-phosphate transaminase [Armatimonadota bacterium]
MRGLVNEHILKLKPYVPGKPIDEVRREFGIKDIVKLASNENPVGPSPKALDAMKKAIGDVALYPDGSCFALTRALAAKWGVGENHIICGNGSDELIHYIGITFLSATDEVISSDVTFSRYESAAVLNNCEYKSAPACRHKYSLDEIAARINSNTRLIIIANPNNPTGTIVTKEEVDRFMAKVPERVIVVFDEAYYEYVESPDYPDTLDYVRQGKNVIILHTFSKIYGLAGLRIGYGIARPEIIAGLHQVREPFNVNSLAQAAAIAALEDVAHVDKIRKINAQGRDYLYAQFDKMGLPYARTEANFIWVDIKQDCRPVFTELLKRGVIIRTGDIFGCPTFIRVTIGTMDENERFIKTIKEVLE